MNKCEYFKDTYMVQWPKTSEKEKYLYELASEYHERTEDFDRKVCTGPIKNGTILPRTFSEMQMINRNALAIKRELEKRAI